MANTRKARTKPLAAVHEDEETEVVTPTYATLNPQAKAQVLLQRLNGLEAEHFQQGHLAEEAEMLGDEETAGQHRQVQSQVEQRIDFVKTRMADLGVQFPESE